MRSPDDTQRIQRLRAGDAAAFEATFREHYLALVRFVRGYVGSSAVAEELVQETFLRLWAARERLDPRGSLRAYIYQAARNQALNHLRHERIERSGEARLEREAPAAAAADPPDRPREEELAAAVAQAVAALPERCRLVFQLSRDHGLSYAEIARALGISVKTVETQMGRALQALRHSLERYRP
ncbi:MAG: RNA polymerase sigma-70 factor [Gemmatimonadetes bacterium]|nr:RNA polymerase sigma-70 factor [Gemmatimonadota bacterium]